MALEPTKLTIEQVEQKLIEGNENFVNDRLQGKGLDQPRRQELVGGQAPHAIILSCADSRVIPEATFDAAIGELFVVRVAGNVADTTSLASIEYAVANLGSKLIVILGHESCGAVTAAVQGGDNGYNLNMLLAHIAPAVSSSNDSSINDVVRENARLQVNEMMNRSEIIRNAVQSGKIAIKPAYYNLKTGKVDFL